MLLGLGLVRHPVGLVHGRHVVHQGDGLHSLVNSAADGLADLGGCRSPGGREVVGGLEKNDRRRCDQTGNVKRVRMVVSNWLLSLWSRFLYERGSYCC